MTYPAEGQRVRRTKPMEQVYGTPLYPEGAVGTVTYSGLMCRRGVGIDMADGQRVESADLATFERGWEAA